MGALNHANRERHQRIVRHVAGNMVAVIAARLMSTYEPSQVNKDLPILANVPNPTGSSKMFLIAGSLFASGVVTIPHEQMSDPALQKQVLSVLILGGILLSAVLQTKTGLGLVSMMCKNVPASVLLGLWVLQGIEVVRLKGMTCNSGDKDKCSPEISAIQAV